MRSHGFACMSAVTGHPVTTLVGKPARPPRERSLSADLARLCQLGGAWSILGCQLVQPICDVRKARSLCPRMG
jgi:hypothetical protein